MPTNLAVLSVEMLDILATSAQKTSTASDKSQPKRGENGTRNGRRRSMIQRSASNLG